MLRRGVFRLLNGDGLHQRQEVPVDCLLLGVDRLGKATQKHRRCSDVLASLGKLRGIVPSVQAVSLNLTGTTLSAARWVNRV